VINSLAELESIPKWYFKADYIETCNCDYGCPCNFNGFPTYGFCRALVLYSIREGNYGDTKLDGIDVIVIESWPKAIHEGNGTLQLYISKYATEDQRSALTNIFYGKAKGEGQSNTSWSLNTWTSIKPLTEKRAVSLSLV
jgi:hypothetical protein